MIKKWMRPSDKASLDIYKTNAEIDKIKQEIIEFKIARWRLWISSVIVPIAVAIATYKVVEKTGYFNAWQKQNENAEFRFKQDTSSYNATKNILAKRYDSLTKRNDSLKSESIKKERLLESYFTIIKGGLTNNEKINSLLFQNADQKSMIDSLNAIRIRISIAAMNTSSEFGKLRNHDDSLRNELTKRETQVQNLFYRIEQLGVDLTYCRNDFSGYLKAARDSLNACLKSSKR